MLDLIAMKLSKGLKEHQLQILNLIVNIKTCNPWDFEFQWPVEGEFSGFVCGRALPSFGKWNDFSPESIHKSMKGGEQHQPNPQISTHTDPQAQWIIPMPSTGLNWQFFLNKTI